MTTYSSTAKVSGFGSAFQGHAVTRLTADERAKIRAGEEVRIAGCPAYRGETDRIVVEINGRFYVRLPKA